jgi:hypothetical protein
MVIQVYTSSLAWAQKEYVIHFLNQHFLEQPWVLLKDESIAGWRFENEMDIRVEYSADFFHDLDRHWLTNHFVPVPLRNGLAHPQHPEHVDLLGTIFYLLSHYDECIQPEKDTHNRVSSMHALLVEKNWHSRCVVNECALLFLQELQVHFAELIIQKPEFKFRITHDVDRPYKYAYEPLTVHLKRGIGSYKFGNTLKRIAIELGRIALYPFLKNKVDPFDHFDWIIQENKNFNSHPFFYWIPIQAHPEYDSKYDLQDSKMRSLVYHLKNQGATMGCHPNYNSSEYRNGIEENWKAFSSSIPEESVKHNRQHFLKFDPLTFPEQLELAGVDEDSSYGWADRTGFRASTSLSYYLFDVKNKRSTKILEIPLCVMDVTVITPRYMNIAQPESVLNEFKKWLELVKAHGGVFCILWHNDTLQYSFYRNVYWKVIKLASKAGNCM